MPQFLVNRQAQPNGDHEVHTLPCPYPPAPENRIDLGRHTTCHEAVAAVKRAFPGYRINGCYFCSNACHTT